MASIPDETKQEQTVNAGAVYHPCGWCVVASDGFGRLFVLAPFNERERAEATAWEVQKVGGPAVSTALVVPMFTPWPMPR
jgi:hypothetical protein